MTVKELKEALNKVNDNRIVILSKDSEGNQFSPLSESITTDHNYLAESTWSGDIGIEKLTPELKAAGYSEEDILIGQPALILWPTN